MDNESRPSDFFILSANFISVHSLYLLSTHAFCATDSLYAFMPRRLSIYGWNIGTSILPIFWQRELKITELYFYDSAIVETVNVDATRCDIL